MSAKLPAVFCLLFLVFQRDCKSKNFVAKYTFAAVDIDMQLQCTLTSNRTLQLCNVQISCTAFFPS